MESEFIPHTTIYTEEPIVSWGTWLYSWVYAQPTHWSVCAVSYKTKTSDVIPCFYQFHLLLMRGKERCKLTFADDTSKEMIEKLVKWLTDGKTDCTADSDTIYITNSSHFIWRREDNEVHIVNDENLRQGLRDYIHCLSRSSVSV